MVPVDDGPVGVVLVTIVAVDDGPVGVVPMTMVAVDDGYVGCSDVEGVGEGDVRRVLSDDPGAGNDNADGLKYFTPCANMVALYGPYVRCREVPCKATFRGKRCLTTMLVPTEGTIYKGHQCKKCDRFYHSICTGAFPDSLVCIFHILFLLRLSHDRNKNMHASLSSCCSFFIRCRRFE